MVKEQALKAWIKKIKAQRHVKSLTDTSLHLPSQQTKNSPTEHICSICKQSGSLLACAQCLQLFHLSCLQLSPLDLPLSKWPCSDCAFSYNSTFLTSLTSFLESQTESKQKILKSLNSQLKKFKNPSKLKSFKKKYPGLVKNGQILYPIEDSLLWSKPTLHKVIFQDFPEPHLPAYPNEYTSDLILICDFLRNFQNFLPGPQFTCELLFTSLNLSVESPLAKTVHITLLKPLTRVMIKSELFRKTGLLNYLVYKSKKFVSIDRILEYSYLSFLEYLFRTRVFKELIEDIDKETCLFFKKISFVEEYFQVSINQKIKLLLLLTCALLETRMFNEECNKRLESSQKLSKDLNDASIQYKNKKIEQPDRLQLANKIEILKQDLRSASVRTIPLGLDRNHKEYYSFTWDPSKLYMRSYPKLSREYSTWSFYCNKSELELLISALSDKGLRESELLSELQSLIQQFPVTLSTKLPNCPVHSEETLKTWVKSLHLSLSSSLQLPVCQSYIKSIDQSSFSSLVQLIINFHQAFNSQSCKLNKKIFSLWDSCALNGVWESALKECKNFSEAFLCMHLLDTLVHKFPCENKVVQVTESAYSVARRSYQQARLSKLKKNSEKEHDQLCYVCGDDGLVVCCEKCSKVAHLGCVNLKRLPEGDWLCASCSSFSSSSQMRSKQIKY